MQYRRSALRQNFTQPEITLWSKLRNRQLNGHKFKRQFSIGRYILDFYCPNKRLAIEVDGDSHFEAKAIVYDQERELHLKAYNVRIIRFTNEEVMKKLDDVLNKIIEILDSTSPSLS